MLELIGSTELWQWDTGRQIDCAGLQAGTKVQFAYSDTQTLSTAVKSVSGANVADVPNQMLLRSGALMVYAYVTEADGASYTKYAARLNVQARPKPDDYVYTPTEVKSWQTIRDEIGDLDDLTTTAKNNLVAAINEAAASGGGGGGSITKDSIVTALGYTPENAANKTTDLSANSTNTQYTGAKAVWDAIPHPEAKTDAMTQAVGKDADGKLWTAPGVVDRALRRRWLPVWWRTGPRAALCKISTLHTLRSIPYRSTQKPSRTQTTRGKPSLHCLEGRRSLRPV